VRDRDRRFVRANDRGRSSYRFSSTISAATTTCARGLEKHRQDKSTARRVLRNGVVDNGSRRSLDPAMADRRRCCVVRRDRRRLIDSRPRSLVLDRQVDLALMIARARPARDTWSVARAPDVIEHRSRRGDRARRDARHRVVSVAWVGASASPVGCSDRHPIAVPLDGSDTRMTLDQRNARRKTDGILEYLLGARSRSIGRLRRAKHDPRGFATADDCGSCSERLASHCFTRYCPPT